MSILSVSSFSDSGLEPASSTGVADFGISFELAGMTIMLEVEMVTNGDRIEKSALAEHIGQFKVARVHQQAMNLTLLDAQSLARKEEITAWLSRAAYDVKYHQRDFEAARKMRHPKAARGQGYWGFAFQGLAYRCHQKMINALKS